MFLAETVVVQQPAQPTAVAQEMFLAETVVVQQLAQPTAVAQEMFLAETVVVQQPAQPTAVMDQTVQLLLLVKLHHLMQNHQLHLALQVLLMIGLLIM